MRKIVLTLLLLAVLAGGGYGGWQWWQDQQAQRREEARQQATALAGRYVDAWQASDYATMTRLAAGAATDLEDTYTTTFEQLSVAGLEVSAGEATLRDPEDVEQGATAPYSATLQIRGLGAWSYDGTIPLNHTPDDRWTVAFSPAVVHPELSAGRQLQLVSEWPERAPILDRDGQPLDTAGTTLSTIVGSVGEITPELLEQLGAPYGQGDQVGLRGLQLAYETQLAGTPAGEIRLVDGEGQPVEVLERFEGTDPRPLETTLDVDLQRDAEAALPPDAPPSAMVVLDAQTSELRAVVNRPTAGFNRALAGQYPPGSTFKVVTATAILRNGVSPDTPVSCPATARVHGRQFSNYQGEVLGDIPFRVAMYKSCNTAFVQLAADLDDAALGDAAADYGFNSDYSFPIGRTVASFPAPKDLAERAGAAIGQARVLATPLHMASVAAGVASGTWKAPRLVADADPGVDPRSLEDVAGDLTGIMQEVPRIGTATGAGIPDGVAGKTGTAEYGSGDPLPTHAWFIGFQPPQPEGRDQVAFSVLFEDGRSGGSVAAPVAARFLQRLG